MITLVDGEGEVHIDAQLFQTVGIHKRYYYHAGIHKGRRTT